MSIYSNIKKSIAEGKRLLAVLIDPDKTELDTIEGIVTKVNQSVATHIFVGGSEVEEGDTEVVVQAIKRYTTLPVILFPGDVIQITDEADGVLFLSLISGRNPDYLIGKHVEAVSKLAKTQLEVLPTGYILIENGKQTAVERVSNTKPLSRSNKQHIVDTAKAGALLGMQLIYLEAGSGATHPIEPEIISAVKNTLNIPLIVGGGIRSKTELEAAYKAGADLVVIGTAFETNQHFFEQLKL
ncbi:geranylgeranylglyceryl/heptaprenylglyceryl phosphate synthase [Winogradskyella sp. J14-2]|uniref:geranylgeranylglyceryl/heptaprenylglyceryl phosphate synthase n=1 Tax=Winogradskyella sp. J14-2 TaxID=1936080 RepID=UPI0009727F48|nr:geranylgeranylglyceryl/heptaprenylglyceryl phosphate synthase [Winogradskyella sp. J14-2]APY08161.1 geranylgeranylglyceryl/heptaprenylglyceryl phosphate synthase [Winogradskyella sp. J14-2]